MSPAVRSAHTAKRARIARTTRLIEKVGLDNSQQAKSVPSEWLPAENLNCRIYTKKTLTELLSKAFDADLVNLTDCYGMASVGCEPDICHLLCTPFSVTPGPDKVFLSPESAPIPNTGESFKTAARRLGLSSLQLCLTARPTIATIFARDTSELDTTQNFVELWFTFATRQPISSSGL